MRQGLALLAIMSTAWAATAGAQSPRFPISPAGIEALRRYLASPAAVVLPPAAGIMTYGGGSLSVEELEGPFFQFFTRAKTPAGTVGVSVGVEVLPAPPKDRDPRMVVRPAAPIRAQAGTLGASLVGLLEAMPEYEMFVSGGVINVAPRAVGRSTSHFMNRRIGKFEVKDQSILETLVAMRERINPAFSVSRNRKGEISLMFVMKPKTEIEWFLRPISLSLENPTPRDVLNAIAATVTNTMWTLTYESASPWLPALMVEESCTILLTRMRNGEPNTVGLPPKRDPSRAAPLGPTNLPMFAGMVAPVTIELPVTPPRLVDTLQQLAHNTHALIGFELGSTTVALPPADTGRGQKYYILSGLSASEALDKIVSFAPGYTWKSTGPMYHVRAKSLATAPTPLDRDVPSAGQRFDNVQQALAGVAAALGSASPSSVAIFGDQFRAVMDRRITVSAPVRTARDLLDAIVRGHGEMSWSVEYVKQSGNVLQLNLTFIGFEPWSQTIRLTMR